MIKARAVVRGAGLGPVFPKVAINPEIPSQLTIVYSSTELISAPLEQSIILDPSRTGWGAIDHLLYAQSGNASYLLDWNRVSTSENDTFWATLTGDYGNGDMMYGGIITEVEAIDLGVVNLWYLGSAITSDGEIFVAVDEEGGEVI